MSQSNDSLVREFVEAFNTRDAERLAPYLHPEIVFQAYGDKQVRGREAVLQLWRGVFGTFAQVQFATVHQAVDGDVVIAEQVHGLGLPGRPVAPVMNMAIYEIRDGKIAAWRDYTNPEYASKLVSG
ncbi:nuclear transport factor 2 family protein [Micromonospora sp. RHAY321]|uniref:nuclear transport factor 2 family protein n=1 Tax=Micromonospora sp. RHAY321 TaxID=2944807 RepID=UPI00207D00BF|nr:nuclear transport factor 2 family protein [Micromonospora sp. RHAY321]MCO1594550.1 nuclear transport factor 2 family protein [Micromonospora sp. RHAY321]